MDIKELTVGIEEEYQVIDPETGELTSYIAEFLERDAMLVKDSMVPEFLKSQLEVTSQVCKNIKEARSEVIRLRQLASNYAKENNCKILVDAAQSVPHFGIQVSKLDCDFLVFSGHKIFAPTGVGVLYVKNDRYQEMKPYQGGCDMIKEVSFEGTTYNELPYKFEAGTPNIADVIVLASQKNLAAQKYKKLTGENWYF